MNQLDLTCVTELSGKYYQRDLRYLAVPQLSSKSLLQQELLLSGIHFQTASPRWLRYHLSEASCLLHRVRKRAHSTAAMSPGVWQLHVLSRPDT